ncbi:hypothetical protein VTK56DRAFT_8252 [Thermocarpiscus australiensis]
MGELSMEMQKVIAVFRNPGDLVQLRISQRSCSKSPSFWQPDQLGRELGKLGEFGLPQPPTTCKSCVDVVGQLGIIAPVAGSPSGRRVLFKSARQRDLFYF